ncbi:MAG: hypothetical protein ACJ788_03815 [Ktedonobacteraceae bacterium]
MRRRERTQFHLHQRSLTAQKEAGRFLVSFHSVFFRHEKSIPRHHGYGKQCRQMAHFEARTPVLASKVVETHLFSNMLPSICRFNLRLPWPSSSHDIHRFTGRPLKYILVPLKYTRERARVVEDLITNSYSKEEARKFSRYTISDADRQAIAQAGRDILTHVPKLPYSCALMSALWGARIRDTTRIPTHVVAGNLLINKRKIFFSNNSSDEVRQVFEKSTYAWDGHVWINFAGIIGDISLFRSAYSESENHWLHQLIVREFGVGKGLLLGAKPNMTYEAKYVLTEENINALINALPSYL